MKVLSLGGTSFCGAYCSLRGWSVNIRRSKLFKDTLILGYIGRCKSFSILDISMDAIEISKRLAAHKVKYWKTLLDPHLPLTAFDL